MITSVLLILAGLGLIAGGLWGMNLFAGLQGFREAGNLLSPGLLPTKTRSQNIADLLVAVIGPTLVGALFLLAGGYSLAQ